MHQELFNKREADRVRSVILQGRGWTPSQVAEASLIDRSTARHYFHGYKKGGVSRLLETNYSRHRGHLNAQQEHALDVYLQEHPHITAKSIAHYIEKRWGIRYSESGITDLLHRLGYVYKKPKLVPGKADAQAQLEFLADYEKLKETKDKADEILFMDAVHPQHSPVMGSERLA